MRIEGEDRVFGFQFSDNAKGRTSLVPRLQPRNTLHRRLLPPQSAREAGASGQCVPGLEPWNEVMEPWNKATNGGLK